MPFSACIFTELKHVCGTDHTPLLNLHIFCAEVFLPPPPPHLNLTVWYETMLQLLKLWCYELVEANGA
jgi:hypothetical protein